MDERLFRWFNRLQVDTGWAHGVAKSYAVYGIALLAVILVAAWWDARGSEDPVAAVAAVGWSVGAALIGAVLVQVIGAAIDRPRPTEVLSGTHLLLDRTADFSFPSDHLTAMSAVAAGLILAAPRLRHRWYGWVAGGLALLMAVTRVYVGAHYPGDVLGGIVLGTSVAVAFAPMGVRLVAWLVAQVTSTPLRPVVARAPVSAKQPR